MRADAQTNRAKILAVADEVFGREGAAASTEDVARLAGVGAGTVFRHFPTKLDLLAAVLEGRLQRLAERARELTEADDGVFAFIAEVVAGAPSKLSIADALADADGASGPLGAPGPERAAAELRAAFTELMARAQASGRVRADARADDVFALTIGVSRGAAFLRAGGAMRERMLGLVFDGLAPQPVR